ncbi:MAG: flavodoxin [Lachnotalea sp.]
MDKIIVAYWSQTGNTEVMAKAIGTGIKESGKEVEVLGISNVLMTELETAEKFALGCPAMGDEILEESEMEPFVIEVEKFVQGKKILLFGSYGWGDGQWMRDWEARMKNAGAIIVNEVGLIAQDSPNQEVEEQCKKIGALLAKV